MMLKQLKRMGLLVLTCAVSLFTISLCAFAKPDWPLDTGCQSEAGIVMDMDSGAVLFAQNIHVQKYPASITKLLTALVVVENASMDDQVTFSHDAVYNVEDGSGNKLQLACMLCSFSPLTRLPMHWQSMWQAAEKLLPA